MASLILPNTILSLYRPRKIKQIITRFKKKHIYYSCHQKLEPLYDDGYMTPKGIKDYHDAVRESLRYNVGPPRWFCPLDCGPPVAGSPLLLFLPGIDGIGMGLFMHHKALGRAFEVRCMHVPFSDRTPFEGLLKFVEDAVRLEHSTSQNRQIYLIGHSFGGCLALPIAAQNPYIDLIVILINPATSFGKSRLQTLIPGLRTLFSQLKFAGSLISSLSTVDKQLKQTLESTRDLSPTETLDNLSRNLIHPLLHLSHTLDNISNETILWKFKLLELASDHANFCLHSVEAEVLVLASCLDRVLPSRDEAKKLAKLLLKCKENGVHLCSIIKGAGFYRRHSKRHDFIKDFLPTTMTELQEANRKIKFICLATSPVMFSTMEDGKIVRGFSGIPNDGPVLLVGNHMLLALDIVPLIAEFLKEKRIVLRGMAHPILFLNRKECSGEGHHVFDFIRLFGAVPSTNRNLYRLLSEKSSILLYPGGPSEAHHRKGEEHKLAWPSQSEFVRMAAQFGATIVPFGVVGEDDILEYIYSLPLQELISWFNSTTTALESDELMNTPLIRDMIKEVNKINLSVVENQELYFPCALPRLPGRFYYLFGKPIRMSEKTELLKDKESAKAMYFHIKSEVENNISYLLRKREEDVYRSFFRRALYQATWGSSHQIPTFAP